MDTQNGNGTTWSEERVTADEEKEEIVVNFGTEVSQVYPEDTIGVALLSVADNFGLSEFKAYDQAGNAIPRADSRKTFKELGITKVELKKEDKAA